MALLLPFTSLFLCVKWMHVCMLVNRYVLTLWQPPSEPCISVRPQADWLMRGRAAEWKMRGGEQEDGEGGGVKEKQKWKKGKLDQRTCEGRLRYTRDLVEKKKKWLWLCLQCGGREEVKGGKELVTNNSEAVLIASVCVSLPVLHVCMSWCRWVKGCKKTYDLLMGCGKTSELSMWSRGGMHRDTKTKCHPFSFTSALIYLLAKTSLASNVRCSSATNKTWLLQDYDVWVR